MNSEILKEAMTLPDSEKLDLIEDLCDSRDNPEDIPLNEDQKAELDRRLQSHYSNPNSGSSWEEVKKRILPYKK